MVTIGMSGNYGTRKQCQCRGVTHSSVSSRISFGFIMKLTGLLLGLGCVSVGMVTTPDHCRSYGTFKMSRDTIPSPPFFDAADHCKEWFIQGTPNATITIRFNYVYVRSIFNGCGDDNNYVHIGPVPDRKLCGSTDSDDGPTIDSQDLVYISKRDHVWIKLYGAGSIGGRFSLQYISGYVPSHEQCKWDEFRCSNGKCVYQDWQCNGADECGDSSDEEYCHVTTHLPPEPTPPHCEPSQLQCQSMRNDHYICLPDSKKCDGRSDCLHHEDENRANCESSCNKVLNGTNGNFTSPHYPLPYPSDINCEWTIQVHGGKIQLRFVEFSLQSGMDTDYVTVYDVPVSGSKLLGKYEGNIKPPKVIESTSNTMIVKFHSDSGFWQQERGFKATFQKKGVCFGSQSPCGYGEENCYNRDERCNGVWECPDRGGDERGCGNCQPSEFSCGKESRCYPEKDRCNGLGNCDDNADEMNCTEVQCGSHNGTFLCANKRCIYETWQCDQTNDCKDDSDEKDCPGSTTRVVIAAVAGSLICALVLVIALGCTLKLYALRLHDQYGGPRHESPMSRLHAEFMRRRAPPPYHEAMLTSRPYDEAAQEYLEQVRQAGGARHHNRRRPRRSGRSRRGENNNGVDNSEDVVGDVCLTEVNETDRTSPQNSDEATNSTNDENVDRQSSTTCLVLSSDTDDSLISDNELNQSEEVQVQLSQASGNTAHWRRSCSPKDDNSEILSTGPDENRDPLASQTDTCSLETVSASCDSVDMSISDGPPKDTETETSGDSRTQSRNSYNTRRSGSQESLNSSGSETLADSQSLLLQA